MNYLLDTHAFLWELFYPKKIPAKIKKIYLDPESIKYISIITFWEISLKYELHKLEIHGILPEQLPHLAKETGFKILNFEIDTICSFYKLPKLNNKDPFDRMLIWQAIQKDMPLISRDTTFNNYERHGLRLIWQ